MTRWPERTGWRRGALGVVRAHHREHEAHHVVMLMVVAGALSLIATIFVAGAAGYVISTKNETTNYQSGGIAHFDYAIGKVISPQVKVGAVGYFVQQMSGDSGAGAIAGERKVRVAGIGPGASFVIPGSPVPLTIVAKYYREFNAQNTTQGNAGTLSARFAF